jgi:FKBP-type peptidyl-prolyl cis-trans isomerase FklB
MLKKINALVISGFAFSFILTPFQSEAQTQPLKLTSELDSVAYGIGLSIAGSLKMQGLANVNTHVLQRAIQDALTEKQPLFSQEEANQFLMSYFTRKEDSIRLAEGAKAEPNRLAGEAFLAENAKKEGVVTTSSGLQYQILKAGDGAKPTLSDQVKVHYHGTLIDGTVFDSSVERGQPIELSVSGVIAGWTEALQLMPVGSKWKLFLPYGLAYGDRAAGPKIPAKSALVFEVELLEIGK